VELLEATFWTSFVIVCGHVVIGTSSVLELGLDELCVLELSCRYCARRDGLLYCAQPLAI
jgi:hypothetical protein